MNNVYGYLQVQQQQHERIYVYKEKEHIRKIITEEKMVFVRVGPNIGDLFNSLTLIPILGKVELGCR